MATKKTKVCKKASTSFVNRKSRSN